MTCHWYHLRIRSTLLDLANLRLKILPSNRTFVSGFMQYGTMEWLEDILSGLRDVGDGLLVDSWDDSVFLKFKEWVLFYEHRYLAVLEKMLYCIDDANFSIVTLEGRPGSVCTLSTSINSELTTTTAVFSPHYAAPAQEVTLGCSEGTGRESTPGRVSNSPEIHVYRSRRRLQPRHQAPM